MTLAWNDIADVHGIILAMASPLTQHLNNLFTYANAVDVWNDAFQMNWEGHFDMLPKAQSMAKSFRYIATKSMYQRVKQYFDYKPCTERALRGFQTDFDGQVCCFYMTTTYDQIQFMVVPLRDSWDEECVKLIPRPTLLRLAIVGGHVNFLEKHFEKCEVVELKTGIDRAAENGQLEMVKYLHEIGSQGCSYWAMDRASMNGHFEVVKWLHENRNEGCTWFAFDQALFHGFLDIAEFLEANVDRNYSKYIIINAARNGNFKVMKHIISNIERIHIKQAFDKYGYADIVQYLDEDRQACIGDAMKKAAARGFLNIVKLLHEKFPDVCTERALYSSFKGGVHKEVVVYLGTNSTKRCADIAIDVAMGYDYLNIIEGLFEHSPELCTARAVNWAVCRGHLSLVKFFHENAVKGFTAKAMDIAATNGHLHIVKYLHQNRTEGCSTDAIDGAASNGYLNIVQFLYMNRSEGYTSKALEMATKHQHFDIVNYLEENRTKAALVR